mmetsp:Transcript_33078/g.37969  ORF Transcript_33078/g.37969 Transcript_33078/m.37969 type:complete len:124 (-) Transcript_33078:606-977(-)
MPNEKSERTAHEKSNGHGSEGNSDKNGGSSRPTECRQHSDSKYGKNRQAEKLVPQNGDKKQPLSANKLFEDKRKIKLSKANRKSTLDEMMDYDKNICIEISSFNDSTKESDNVSSNHRSGKAL